MQKIKITVLLCLSVTINLYCQTIIDVKQDAKNYPELGKDENVFYVKKDSVKQGTNQIESTQELLLIGKCNGWNVASCGIMNLSMFAEKTARTRGYNAVSVNYYRGTSKKDTLSVVFYRLMDEKILELQQNKNKCLILINPKNGSDRDVKVNGEAATVYAGTYLLKEVSTENMSVKLGKGFLSSSASLGFKKAIKRYFIINGYQLAGAPRGIGIGVSAPTLMEVSQLSGEIIIEFLAKLGDTNE